MINAPKIRLKESFEITVLICYLLENLGPLTEKLLLEITTLDDMVGVFDLSEALGIIESKGLATVSESLYSVTDEGRLLVKEFSVEIPLSIREKTLAEGKKILKYLELRKSIDWSISKKENGYKFSINFKNEIDGSTLLDISLHAFSYENALEIENRFLKKPIDTVKNIMYLLISGD